MKTLKFDEFETVCSLNCDKESSACYHLVRHVYNYVNDHRNVFEMTRDKVALALTAALVKYNGSISNRDFMNDYAYFCDRVMNDCF